MSQLMTNSKQKKRRVLKIERNNDSKRRRPAEAIHAYCVDCVGSSYIVKKCSLINCQFYTYRMGRGRPRMKSVRRFCLECINGSKQLVRNCPSTGCTVWPFRMGKNPNRAGIGNITRFNKPQKMLVSGVFPS
jgi:hypothetical protein